MSLKERIIGDLKLSEERFQHTMGVAKCAKELVQRHFPALSADKMEIAALLHDFTKEYTLEEQKELCKKYNIYISPDEADVPKLYHAKTAAAIAKYVYGVDKETESAIYYHTTGRAGMTDAEAVIYFADYIEENRTDNACVEVREYYLKRLKKEEDPLVALKKAILYSLDMTIKHLINIEQNICTATIEARNDIIKYLNQTKGA
jgi:predicted HD superfamily hydrolase involved in NAD metabolism